MIRAQIQQGHSILNRLDLIRNSGRIPHALCLAGSDLQESKRVALTFAQDLLCTALDINSKVACGRCGACVRIENKQSESVLMIAPEKDQLKISDTRSILDYLSRASDSKAQVIIIENAQLLNKTAANAFLKTLEEPSLNVVFILLVVDHNSLMPTIRSRVQVFRQQVESWAQVEKMRAEKYSTQDSETARQWLQAYWLDEAFLDRTDWKDVYKDRTKFSELLRAWIVLGLDHTTNRKVIGELKSISEEKMRNFIYELVQMESGPRTNEDSVLNLESLWIRHIGAQHG